MKISTNKVTLVMFLVTVSSILMIIGVVGILPFDCDDTVKLEVASPDGRYMATVFERDCGATTDYATHVSLRKAGEPFYVADQTRTIVVVKGREPVEPGWITERVLTIAFPRWAVTFNKLETWRDVRIEYKLVR